MVEKLYCPICTAELDNNYSHWVPCEYEADYAKPEYAPLTRTQMLVRRISDRKFNLKQYKECVKQTKAKIAEYEKELNQL